MTQETLVQALGRVVATGPHRTAIRAGGEIWTFGQLWERSGRIAAALRGRHGIQTGDRVGILGQNDPEYLGAYFGILRAGCVAVPLNQFLLASDLVGQLGLVGARLCLIGLIDPATAGFVAASLPALPIKDLLTAAEAPLPPVAVGADATILLTSGTTGLPKGAIQTHATMRFATAELHGAMPFSPDDVMLSFLPFFAAIPEQILPTLLAGGAVEALARFDLDAVADACTRATTFDAVPTIMARLLHGVDHKHLAHLQWLMFASEPMPPALLHAWWEALPDVQTYQFYGMTEMLTITVAPPATLRAAPHSVGVPFPGSKVAIVDAHGQPLPQGESGEVVCLSPARMRGYMPEGIDPATWQLPSGAMKTGDLGQLDEGGRLLLTGRIKDLIISGGLNIAPSEIEAVAVTHPAVAAAVVVGIPDARWGETPVVVAIAKQGATLTPLELLAYCRGKLASYKRPTGAALVERFPMTGIGKSSKSALRSAIESGAIEVTRAS